MKKIFCVIGIIVGMIIIILGFVVLGLDTGSSYISSAEFGADFYTYCYKAIKIAADNVISMAKIVNRGIAFLLIAIGATDICIFGYKLVDEKNLQIIPVIDSKEPFTSDYNSEKRSEI